MVINIIYIKNRLNYFGFMFELELEFFDIWILIIFLEVFENKFFKESRV